MLDNYAYQFVGNYANKQNMFLFIICSKLYTHVESNKGSTHAFIP